MINLSTMYNECVSLAIFLGQKNFSAKCATVFKDVLVFQKSLNFRT